MAPPATASRSARWWPQWGCPAFNGGKGPFHEIWEYTGKALGFDLRWEEDAEGGWDEAFAKLCGLIDRGIPVQVGLHYSLLLPYGANNLAAAQVPELDHAAQGFGHHVVISGYDLAKGTVTIFEPNDIMPHAKYEAPIAVFRQAWEEANQRGKDGFEPWVDHKAWNGEWTLHDGYGPYLMIWVEARPRSEMGYRGLDPPQLPPQHQDPRRRVPQALFGVLQPMADPESTKPAHPAWRAAPRRSARARSRTR